MRPVVPETEQTQQLVETARRLWRGSFQGMLSTHSAAHPGYPFGTVVPCCLDRDGMPLLLLSHLAQHCKNLLENPACGLLLSEPGNGDIQQSARLSLVADCRPIQQPDPQEAERYFRYFPQSRPYFEQLNFRFFRLQPRHFHLNAGFAAARWLGVNRVVQAISFDGEQESAMRHRAARDQDLLRGLFPPRGAESADTPVSVAGIDPMGMDLRMGQRLLRRKFPTAVNDEHALQQTLESLRQTHPNPHHGE